MSALEIVLIVALTPIVLAVLAFWVWMLVDCLKYEGRAELDRVLWVIVLIGIKFVGAILYYALRYRNRHPRPEPIELPE